MLLIVGFNGKYLDRKIICQFPHHDRGVVWDRGRGGFILRRCPRLIRDGVPHRCLRARLRSASGGEEDQRERDRGGAFAQEQVTSFKKLPASGADLSLGGKLTIVVRGIHKCGSEEVNPKISCATGGGGRYCHRMGS